MNIVKSDAKFQVYGMEIATYDKLPVDVYDLNFNKMQGFFLTQRNPLTVSEKIYGNSLKRAEKILRTFNNTNRNFGVILSGRKGIGKTILARLLAEKVMGVGIPVINISSYLPGLSSFLESLQQEVMVLFDEFEKTFCGNDEHDPQEELLSVFDGTGTGKKLFVITCNETQHLNEYLLNRPGRFHYHFTFDIPTRDEIREYLGDNLSVDKHDLITNIIKFSSISELTYDCLRAITTELNAGYSLQDTLEDLNIDKDNTPSYTLKVYFESGDIFESMSLCRFYPTRKEFVSFWLENNFMNLNIRFAPAMLQIDDDGVLFMDNDGFKLATEPDHRDKLKEMIPVKLVCEQIPRFKKFHHGIS